MQSDRSLEKELPVAHSRYPFPVKLYTMLELADVKDTGCSGAVTWLSHGRAFKIHDEKEFMEVNVPMYFKQTKIRSFYRQLNLWGYKRVLNGFDAGAWYNDFFLRGYPEEIKKMRRIKIKRNSKLDNLGYQKEPDFDSMPALPREVTKSATGGVMETRAGRRRVSLDLTSNGSSTEEFQFSGNVYPNPEELSFPMPEPTFSRCVSSLSLSYNTPQPRIWNACIGTNHQYGGTIYYSHEPQQAGHLDKLFSPINSGGINQQLSPTAKSSVIFPCDNKVKCRSTAGLEPLPFLHETTSSAIFPTDNGVKNRPIARLKPLPFKSEIPFDEFASYIDTAIQLL